MVASKELKAVVISGKDSDQYVRSTSNINDPFTTMATVLTYTNTPGLSAFKKALDATQEGQNIADLKEAHQKSLLNDIEMLSKKESFDRNRKVSFEKSFYDEIKKSPKERSPKYKEFMKFCADRAADSTAPIAMGPESLSIIALMELDKENTTIESVKDGLKEGFESFLKAGQGGFDNDVKERGAVYYKGKDGKTNVISAENLKSGKFPNGNDIPLNDEQKEFITHSWSQAAYGSGWMASLVLPITNNKEEVRNFYSKAKGSSLLIDWSSKGKVKLYNSFTIISPEIDENGYPKIVDDALITNPSMEASIEVDITSLKGEKFTPGCCSTAPEISVELRALEKGFYMNTPEGLKVAPGKSSTVYEYIENTTIEASVTCIMENGSNAVIAARAVRDLRKIAGRTDEDDLKKTPAFLSSDNNSITEKMEYVLREFPDTKVQKAFANKYLYQSLGDTISKTKDKDVDLSSRAKFAYKFTNPKVQKAFVDALIDPIIEELSKKWDYDTYSKKMEYVVGKYKASRIQKAFANKYLDQVFDEVNENSTIESIKSNMKEVLEPLCKGDKEKARMKENVDKLVDKMASEEKTGWSKKWSQLKEKVGDVIDYAMGRNNIVKKMVRDNPDMKENIKSLRNIKKDLSDGSNKVEGSGAPSTPPVKEKGSEGRGV